MVQPTTHLGREDSEKEGNNTYYNKNVQSTHIERALRPLYQKLDVFIDKS